MRGSALVIIVFVLAASLAASGFQGIKVWAETTSIEVVDVFWGSVGTPVAVGPGDRGVPLTLMIQNTGSEIVSGVNVYLNLQAPFSNITGGSVAKGYLTSSLQPSQASPVQFLVNVRDGASIGQHTLSARITYMTVRQYTESSTSSSSDTDQTTSSTSRTSTSQSSSTTGTPPDTSSSGSSTSDTSQSSTSSSDQKSSSTSTSYTRFTVNNLERRANVTVWLTGKVLLDVNVITGSIVAGEESLMQIEVVNKGSADASSLTLSLSLPSGAAGQTLGASSAPLILVGNDNQWYFQSVPAGEKVTVYPKLLGSNGAIDSALQMQVTMAYRDNVGSVKTDTRSIGVLVKGSIKIVLQDLVASPHTVGAGGNITISGTILNEGTVSAMYMNASTITTYPFTAYDGSSSYIGELSPNTPMPFSLNVGVEKDALNGTYPLKLLFYYKDSYGGIYSLEKFVNATVQGKATVPPLPEPTQFAPRAFLLTVIVSIVAVAALSSLATYFVTKRRTVARKGA